MNPYKPHGRNTPGTRLPPMPPPKAPAAGVAPTSDPLNDIPATMRHDEGAYARCSYCGRYSLDPETLNDDRSQPVCECGKKHGWSGSFKKPGPDAKWSVKTPAGVSASDHQTAAREDVMRMALDALTEISAMYVHAWDRAEDGALLMLPLSIPRFEAAHEKVQSARDSLRAAIAADPDQARVSPPPPPKKS